MRCLIWILVLLLSSCYQASSFENNHSKKRVQTKKNNSYPPRYGKNDKDGAPTDSRKITFKKVKPIDEPLSRYGNPSSYAVEGRTYNVMRTASGYKTRGLASWYGTKFHKQRTSSGEAYDMYAMTAAHRTLPLPSYVKVKNLNNGRETIVKVNDRGPFHSDRIIDLSYAAALKLGLMPKGTALVEIEALTFKKPGKPRVAHYYVQAGVFNSNKWANIFRGKLAKLTPSPVFVEKSRQQYIVKVGPFAQKAMSNNLKKQLDKQGIKGSFCMLQ
jgi:rare lipoprotein A